MLLNGNHNSSNGGTLLMKSDNRMGLPTLPPATDYSLECRQLSYIRSFTAGRWHSKVFNPPISAQFLKDVNFEMFGGEMLGVTGSSGSGKTTLLNAVAGRVQGTVGGVILLNRAELSATMFADLCEYISMKETPIPCISVKETLNYHAQLTLSSSMSATERNERVVSIMQDFELINYAHEKVEDLSESARRRLIIGVHLLRDPILIIIDEPTKDLEALSSYQLMYNLHQYIKRYRRMALISMQSPRSDIYQLFDRIMILFFGETIYSGYTKQMPVYFRSIGYPCPAFENPAIYYLSMATVDRETTERYIETQDQAMKLIETFKMQGDPYSCYRGAFLDTANGCSTTGSSDVAICHFGRPDPITKLLVLIRRNIRTLFSTKTDALCRLLLLPFCTLFLVLFGFRLTPSWTLPQSLSGLLFNYIAIVSFVSTALTALCFSIHRTRYYQDSFDNVYGGVLAVLAHLIAVLFFDIFSIALSSVTIFWLSNLHGGIISYLKLVSIVWSCWQFSQLHIMCWMIFVKSSFKAFSIVSTLTALLLIFAGGFLKTYRTFRGSTDWLIYLTYGSIYRYAMGAIYYDQIESIRGINCTIASVDRAGVSRQQLTVISNFCRWENGSVYLSEIYPEHQLENQYWINYAGCIVSIIVLTIVTIILYALPLPHVIERKFRYK